MRPVHQAYPPRHQSSYPISQTAKTRTVPKSHRAANRRRSTNIRSLGNSNILIILALPSTCRLAIALIPRRKAVRLRRLLQLRRPALRSFSVGFQSSCFNATCVAQLRRSIIKLHFLIIVGERIRPDARRWEGRLRANRPRQCCVSWHISIEEVRLRCGVVAS
jgi:hypothetical protein